jgi:hypothetical protein
LAEQPTEALHRFAAADGWNRAKRRSQLPGLSGTQIQALAALSTIILFERGEQLTEHEQGIMEQLNSGEGVNTDHKPRAWIKRFDDEYVPAFRHDVPIKDARELEVIMRQAFNAGVLKGYAEAKRHALEETA